MSNTSLPESRALPRHPLLSNLPLISVSAQRDALENAASTLMMLADFIGGTRYEETLEISPRARTGLWHQLSMVAETLDAVSAALIEADDARIDAAANMAAEPPPDPA